jgi:hypothetical protein
MARGDISGSELWFRALCYVGWNIYQSLDELREICAGNTGSDGWAAWIDKLQTEAMEAYKPSSNPPNSWLPRIRGYIGTFLSSDAFKGYPNLQEFFERILLAAPDPQAGNFDHQLGVFNQQGYSFAGQMLRDSDWSTEKVAAHWGGILPYDANYTFVEDTASFFPVTVKEQHFIELRIEKHFTDFKKNHALLAYLTLEFQFLHEYVSHALPIWSDVGLEEVMLLSVTYDWYLECPA